MMQDPVDGVAGSGCILFKFVEASHHAAVSCMCTFLQVRTFTSFPLIYPVGYMFCVAIALRLFKPTPLYLLA